ncbi:MAG: hypothetical protein KDE27_32395 [Planctomycetes bacterium]|nr:hypothetical protein [Planctomycetota bacterium]
MKKLIINGVIAAALFCGSLVGGLAATGRLNHDGVANIPILSSFFPAPPPEEGHEGAEGEGEGADPHAAPQGEVAAADHSGEAGVVEASHAESQDPQGEHGTRRTKTGKSVVNPEPPPDAGGGGHGGGEAEAEGGGHGEPAHGGDDKHDKHDKPKAGAGKGREHGAAGGDHAAGDSHDAERDFSARELALAQEKANQYSPGGYFKFSGMPAGLTPEQLNEAWQRVQAVLSDLESRKTALDLREKELADLADDISRRHLELGRLREEITTAQRALDDRIAQFREQVKLVRNDEVEALRRNAKTLESFEATKAAELVTEQWGTEQGQTEVLKTFEFMNKDKVNEIIAELANPLIQDVLKKRLLVSKESAASKDGR